MKYPILLLTTLFLAGCLSKAPLAKQSFAFSLPPVPKSADRPGTRVLEMRQLRIAAPYDSQSFIYRTGPFSYERDPYAEFLVPPAESFLPPLRAYFQDSGLFGEVTGRDGVRKPDTIAEIYIGELYGDFRSPSAPAAVLRMSFIFSEVKAGSPGKVLLERAYDERIPFKPRTAAALMAGWNTALSRVMTRVISDFRQQQK